MSSKSQKLSLVGALLGSIVFHFAAFYCAQRWLGLAPRPEAPPPVLQARLSPTPAQKELPAAVLKNTLQDESPLLPPPPAQKTDKNALKPATPKLPVAPKQDSVRLLYPPEAVARGLEGEPVLVVEVDAAGRVVDVGIGSSSGHPILDDAAVKYVWELGVLEGLRGKTVLFPVKFYLQ